MERIQIFNIKYNEHCEYCKFSQMSDLFYEPMCNNSIDSHILYPEIDGDKECPFIQEEQQSCL